MVGESGCGKSTLARAVLQLLRAGAAGAWCGWAGSSGTLPQSELRALRRELQIIFQDPLGEPRSAHDGGRDRGRGAARARPASSTAARAQRGGRARRSSASDCRPELGERYPHELSGGQCQRVGIARAMILAPQLLVCDEPVSALDVPTQQQIVALLAELKRESGLCLLFVSHNLAVVRQLCERVLVLYLGRMMELAPAPRLYAHAAPSLHPRAAGRASRCRTRQLQPARLARVRAGEPPSPLAPPSGCVYRTRCPHALAVCAAQHPRLGGGDAPAQRVACHRWRELPP